MTIDGYNKYIKNYLENDKTQSAIMLTAPWGAGKSYYIKNNLTKFLEKKKNRNGTDHYYEDYIEVKKP